MCPFALNIDSIEEIDTLIDLKESLKNEIMKNMPWQKRMKLYQKIQEINARIRQLDHQKTTSF